MIHLSLVEHRERVHPDEGFFPEEFIHQGRVPLYSQWRTFDALANRNTSIVLNTYATGSGKTKAALLYLRELRRNPFARANCLFIAPTNELLRQHAQDIRAFCSTNQLDYQILPLTRADMDDYATMLAQAAPEMSRRAAKMVEILKNPRVLPDIDKRDASQQRPYILVTNPDIFYYAVYGGYGRNEEREMMKLFLGNFNYLVIDEFHYYNPKQLANFLFFLSVWRHYGYFDNSAGDGAKVCLLSATPNARVRSYLDSLDVSVEEISPDNEPQLDDLPSVTSLAPVELDAIALDDTDGHGLLRLIETYANELHQWLDADQQGAIISSALWRINLIYSWLRRSGIAGSRYARLTGAETREARAAATVYDLILATPTVDIGYNFERPDKLRQNLDFLFFDAAFPDEFVQRLGRAGRVLGKQQTTTPSHVLATLPKELIEALCPLEGKPVSRAELHATLHEAISAGRLPERNSLFDYIASGAIEEAFLPILRLRQMAGSANNADIDELYERVRTLFKASETYRFGRLEAVTRRFRQEQVVFSGAPIDPHELTAHLLGLPEDKGISLWLQSLSGHRPPENVLAQVRALVNKPGAPNRGALVAWATKAQREYAVREASFSFRESFEEPLARLYDPQHLISSADTADYGVFHVVQNCDLEVLGLQQWTELSGFASQKAPSAQILLHCVVRGLRDADQRTTLRFRLRADSPCREWESDNLCKMTALSRLEVYSDIAQVPAAVMDAVRNRFIPAFLTPRDSWIGGKLLGVARNQGMRTYNLTLSFPQGAAQEYLMLLGTSALLTAARLRRECAIYWSVQEKDFHEPIWC